jgi:hypothetical protein
VAGTDIKQKKEAEIKISDMNITDTPLHRNLVLDINYDSTRKFYFCLQ